MASFNTQAGAASASKLVLPITGGSCSEPANKKQKKEAQRRVQHVGGVRAMLNLQNEGDFDATLLMATTAVPKV